MLLYVYASFCINRQEHAMGPLVVLAYSGGLDTSAIVPWLREKYAARVLCFAADVGQGPGELAGLVEKAKRSGARVAVQGARGSHRLRESQGRAGPGHPGETVLHRPQPLALLPRGRHPRGYRARAA